MTTGHDRNVITGLIGEMVNAEQNLSEVDERVQEAQARFEVASRKYAALRDMAAKYIGQNPYSWMLEEGVISLNEMGKYRFIHMPIGNAVVAALQEIKEPAGLADIAKRLRSGGIRRSPESLIRAVNAALIRTKGVVKDKNDKYRFEEPEPQDSPW